MLSSILSVLLESGFMPHAQDATFFSARPADKGRTLPGVSYLYRAHGARHQYASVITYDGAFCEVVIETYATVRRFGAPFVGGFISRSVDELAERLAA